MDAAAFFESAEEAREGRFELQHLARLRAAAERGRAMRDARDLDAEILEPQVLEAGFVPAPDPPASPVRAQVRLAVAALHRVVRAPADERDDDGNCAAELAARVRVELERGSAG